MFCCALLPWEFGIFAISKLKVGLAVNFASKQVSPAAGIITPDHITEISVHHQEFHTLEEFVDGVPQNWWCEDARDKEVILLVRVRGSFSTGTRTHRIRVRHSFSGKNMRVDNKDKPGHIQANVLQRSDLQRLSCSAEVADQLRNLQSP